MRAKLNLVIRLSIGIGLIVAICWSIDLNVVVETLVSLDPGWFLMLCFAAIFIKILKSYKWWLLLCARDISISPVQSTRLYFEGNILGALTPGGVGSDIYRLASLSGFQKHNDVISTLMIERFIGYMLLGMIAVITLPLSAKYIEASTYSALWSVVILFILSGSALLVLLQLNCVKKYIDNILIPRIPLVGKVKNLFSTLYEFRHHGFLLMFFIMLTALEILMLVIISYTAARSLDIFIPFLFLLPVIPLMQFIIRLPVSFQALGVQEGLYVYILVAAGFSASDGLSVSILLRIVEVILIFLPGILMLSTRSKAPKIAPANHQKTRDYD
jgi:hypothetical protein